MEKRSLYYATIIYEESVKDNWLEILENLHIPCLISPLHDRDLDKQGKFKKAHKHILFIYESLKSKSQCKEVIDMIGGVGCEIVTCPKSYALYLAHQNAPDKAQYNPDEIISLSGGDKYLENTKISSIDKYEIISDIIRYCQKENIDCLADIIEFSLENKKEWFFVLADGYSSIMLTNYLKSRTWRKQDNHN